MASLFDKEKWDAIAIRDTRPYSVFYEEWQIRERLDFVNRLRNGALLLDLGSGVGRDLTLFYNLGLTCVGLDFSREMLRQSTIRSVVNATMTIIPFRKNTFDAVWSCSSLKYLTLPNVLSCLKEVRRVLKTNGLFWVGLDFGKGKQIEPRAHIDVALMKYDNFGTILENARFKIINVQRINAWRPFINFLCLNL